MKEKHNLLPIYLCKYIRTIVKKGLTPSHLHSNTTTFRFLEKPADSAAIKRERKTGFIQLFSMAGNLTFHSTENREEFQSWSLVGIVQFGF